MITKTELTAEIKQIAGNGGLSIDAYSIMLVDTWGGGTAEQAMYTRLLYTRIAVPGIYKTILDTYREAVEAHNKGEITDVGLGMLLECARMEYEKCVNRNIGNPILLAEFAPQAQELGLVEA